MSAIQDTQPYNAVKRTIFLFGNHPSNRDLVLKSSVESGLRAVLAQMTSDGSASDRAKIHPSFQAQAGGPIAGIDTEILPNEVDAISADMLTRLRRDYGNDWCVLALNDYVAEYVAAFCTRFGQPCYPPRSAVIVKRKHELRDIWNTLARKSPKALRTVEYCYIEQRENSGEFDYSPSSGFNALPENTTFVVKPDELSSSIEIHTAASKKEAMEVAGRICDQLQSKWFKVGSKIGVEVRPRVVMETAIERSEALHFGAEYSAELLSFQGRHHCVGVTQKWTGPNFVEAGQVFPSESFPAHLRSVLESAMEALLTQLKVQYGLSHWEFIVTPEEQIGLVEGHLRPAGDRIMELVENSTGVNPLAVLCQALAGKHADFSFVPHRVSGMFWMVPQTPLAEVSEIKVEDATKRLCQDLFINQEGIKATPNWSCSKDWFNRFAHVMATGEDIAHVLDSCREAASHVVLYGKKSGGPASSPLMLTIDQ